MRGKTWGELTHALSAENDVTIAADLPGDSIETVMRHYVDPLRKRATEAADRFVREAKKRQEE